MQFKARVYSTPYFGHFLTVLATVFFLILVFDKAYFYALGLLSLIATAVVRLRIRRMTFSETTFHYDGWFHKLRIPYEHIRRVESSSKVGYPADRWYGPNEYRITRERGKRYWVSLLWFGPDGVREFHKRLIDRGIR